MIQVAEISVPTATIATANMCRPVADALAPEQHDSHR